MKILIACEYSGIVREAFKRKGHEAVSCDILPTEIPGDHYEGNVLDILEDDWDLMIAHPPCTYLANSGVCHLHKDPSRWPRLFSATKLFKILLEANIPKKAIENPIIHKYARRLIDSNYSQIIHPYMFGHPEQKATCLWLRGLPELEETNNVKEEMMKLSKKERQRLHYLPPSKDRAKIRSATYQGIADAMAEQWG